MNTPSPGPRCGLCNQGRLAPGSWQRDRRKGVEGRWQMWACDGCGALQLLPQPSAAELGAYYERYLPKGQAVRPPALVRADRHPRLRRLYHWLSGDVDPRDLLRPAKGAKVLDYGCGPGSYMPYFAAAGVDIEGIDVSADAVALARQAGLQVQRADIGATLPFPDHHFDAIYLMQVLEHLPNPVLTLVELDRVLRPGGTLLIAVPNAASLWRRVFGTNWVAGWFAPFHLYHFTRESVERLLGGHGYALDGVFSRTPSSWFSLNCRAALRRGDDHIEACTLPAEGLLRVASIPLLRLGDFLYGGDCLVVRARKQDAVPAR